MVKKKDLSNILRTLAGRCNQRMLVNDHTGPFNNDSITTLDFKRISNENLKNIRVTIDLDDPDMSLFRLQYSIIKKRFVTMRDIIPGKITKYVCSIGRFHPDYIAAFVKNIPDEAVVDKIEIVHSHKIYKVPADYRRKVTIGEHDLYIDVCSDATTYVTIDKDGCNINNISRSTKIFYEPKFYRSGRRKYAISKRANEIIRGRMSFNRKTKHN